MKKFGRFVAVVVLLCLSPAWSATLELGSDAPGIKVEKWVKGNPVDLAARKGKGVTIVEFWATWCAPCVQSVPHLTEIQHKYASKNVRIAAITARDPGNTEKIVRAFVGRMGDKLDYAVGFDADGDTYDAYMTAARQESIPTAFIVDKQGKVAWIGHPLDGMDVVLDQVVAGTYDVARMKRLIAIEGKIESFAMAGKWSEMVGAVDEALALDPGDIDRWMTKFLVYAYQLDDSVKANNAAMKAFDLAADDPDKLAEVAMQIVSDSDEHGYTNMAISRLVTARRKFPANVNLGIAFILGVAASGQTDHVGDVATQVIEGLRQDSAGLGQIANVLSAPEFASFGAPLAKKAIDLAIAREPKNPDHYLTKFRIHHSSLNDVAGATDAGESFVENAEADANLLNGFAWTLLSDPTMSGKYDALAVTAAEAMRVAPGGDGWSHLETLALAKFRTGKVKDAIRIQGEAIAKCDQDFAKMNLQAGLLEYQKSGKK